MYEGKHIHFSPVDQKPLCSFSTKLCRQRRLNGYAFCIRHILEDPSAPFRVCSFNPPTGQNKCTNVISNTHPKGLCNTHLQLAGFPAAKRERRQHRKDKDKMNSGLASPPNGKLMSHHMLEPTSSSVDMSDEMGDPYSFSDDADQSSKACEPHDEDSKKSPAASSPPRSPLVVQPLTPSSTSSSGADSNAEMNLCKRKPVSSSIPNGAKLKPVKPLVSESKSKLSLQTVRKKKVKMLSWPPNSKARLAPLLQQLDDSIGPKCEGNILPLLVADDSDEDAPAALSLPKNFPSASAGSNHRAFKLERRKNEMRRRYLELVRMIQADEKTQGRRSSELAVKLIASARRFPDETGLLLLRRKFQNCGTVCPSAAWNGLGPSSWKIFSKRRCSFRRTSPTDGKEENACPEFSLPCSTLCSRHILYSVDQQLFEFCSARGAAGPTPCGAPVLAIHSGLPFCAAHVGRGERSGSASSESMASTAQSGSSNCMNASGTSGNASGGKSARRKARSRSTSLGRHTRRLRNRRRTKRGAVGDTETRIHCVEESGDNGMELDVETVDSPENCSPAYPTPAQLIPHAAHATVPAASMASTASTAAVSSVEQEAEILEDHDLKELLNRLPDEAFQEIFAMTQGASSSRNGGLFVPSREEAEELERALADDDGVPIASSMLDKFGSALANVSASESDLSDLSLIDDHALALAHDLVMSAAANGQSLLLPAGCSSENAPGAHFLDHSSHLDNLIHATSACDPLRNGYATDSDPAVTYDVCSRRRSQPLNHMIMVGQQSSPQRGSSPPSMAASGASALNHTSDSYLMDGDSTAHHSL